MSPPIRDGSGNSIGSIRLGDGTEISEVRTGAGDVLFSALPDSARNQYLVGDFSTTIWSDSVGTVDIDQIERLTFDSTAFGGKGGVVGGGSDYGVSESMDDFGNNIFPNQWALAFQFEDYTETASNMFIGKNGSPTSLTIGSHGFEGGNQDRLQFQFQGGGGSGERNAVESDRAVNNGATHTVILQKEGTNAANSMVIYFSDAVTNGEQNILTNASDPSGGNLGEVGYLTWWDGTNPDRTTPMSIRNPRWFSDSLTESERKDVFALY